MQSADSKSGAQFERVEIDGDRYVLKHVDRANDWIARQTGDLGCWPVMVWEHGLVDLVPDCIDHTIVGAARTETGGAVLMRDVSAWLVPSDDSRLPLEQHLRFLDHLAAFHASTWGWDDTVGLCPLANRYAFFGPAALECEAALGNPAPVPRLAAEGWERLRDVSPDLTRMLAPLRDEPWRLVEALAGTPQTFLHGDWKAGNLGSTPDGRTVLLDWSMPGVGPPLAELAHYLGLNVARFPAGHTKDDAIRAYRAALEQHGVDTAPWWDRQLTVCLLGIMVQLAWNKVDDEPDELAWWTARVREGVDAVDRR
ncbi:MAG TPA: phosphotransferase [Acidimicrobiia bacterium]|nr:phosphotransferase [Acidimicrobiia bacterium]